MLYAAEGFDKTRACQIPSLFLRAYAQTVTSVCPPVCQTSTFTKNFKHEHPVLLSNVWHTFQFFKESFNRIL